MSMNHASTRYIWKLHHPTICRWWFAHRLCCSWVLSFDADHVSSSWYVDWCYFLLDFFIVFGCVLTIIHCRCLIGLILIEFIRHTTGGDLLIDGIPIYCPQFNSLVFNTTVLENLDESGRLDSSFMSYSIDYTALASVYLLADIAWIVMLWSASSIGTPTEPMRRDKYVR